MARIETFAINRRSPKNSEVESTVLFIHIRVSTEYLSEKPVKNEQYHNHNMPRKS